MGLDAVLFDWGDTLFHFAYDEALLEAGWEAGLQATGRDDLPGHEDAAARFREGYLPLLFVPGTVEEIEYPGLIRALLAGFDIELTDDELGRFLEAEHEAWSPAREMGDSTHALLESLRGRGLKLGLVSNEADGTVSVIDLATRRKVSDIQVGGHLSHPRGSGLSPFAIAIIVSFESESSSVLTTQYVAPRQCSTTMCSVPPV